MKGQEIKILQDQLTRLSEDDIENLSNEEIIIEGRKRGGQFLLSYHRGLPCQEV